jgi:hypothetical protein
MSLFIVWENTKWAPMLTIFLSGLSLHVSQALLSHFFEIEMVWGSTAKEVDNVVWSAEVARVLRRFKWTFVFCILSTMLMISAYHFFPENWRITAFYSIYPYCTVVVGHIALPLFLNPALMQFKW